MCYCLKNQVDSAEKNIFLDKLWYTIHRTGRSRTSQ